MCICVSTIGKYLVDKKKKLTIQGSNGRIEIIVI